MFHRDESALQRDRRWRRQESVENQILQLLTGGKIQFRCGAARLSLTISLAPKSITICFKTVQAGIEILYREMSLGIRCDWWEGSRSSVCGLSV